jgi:ABC-type oligopeptide transport system substrate-binding subunit
MKSKRNLPNFVYFFLLIFLVGILAPANISAENIKLSSGQTVYVSIYSHIYSGLKARPFDLAAILSIRNTNPNNSITLRSVKYYDSDGKLLKEYLSIPLQLNALVSTRYIITEGDKAGGSGANFIVVWKSDQKVNPPIIEAVMIGTHSGQGISFVSRGQVIKEDR